MKPVVPKLDLIIRIPKFEISIEILILKLRYLETVECRLKYGEEKRIEERKRVTQQFRDALRFCVTPIELTPLTPVSP